jgi:hypothetical protein
MSIEGGFTPTASMAALGEKLGTDPQIDHPSCCRLCQEPFFSAAVTLSIVVNNFVKGCYALTTWDTYGLGPYAYWAWDACDVLVEFSPAGCISIRIAATPDMCIACWYGSAVTHLRTGKSAENSSFEELMRTPHHRARCGPWYCRVLVFVSLRLRVLIFEHFIIYVLWCNSRTHVITHISGHVCDVLCVNASVLATHKDRG